MATTLITSRYAAFAIFTICNAVICSVAVWNFTSAREIGLNPQVDIFLLFLGALGVLFILPIMFLDVFRRNALLSRVWCECAWVGTFWMLYLGGASATTAVLPGMMCSASVYALFPSSAGALCSSTRVLQAFTWLGAITLLLYLVGLITCSLMHHDLDNGVWQSGVRFFPWFQTRASLGSTPSSPTHSKSWQKPLSLAVPKPQRPTHQATMAHPSTSSPAMQAQSRSAAAPRPMRQATRELVLQPQPATSMYPSFVQAQLPQSRTAMPQHNAAAAPLGDWPRTMQEQRARPTRKPTHAPQLSDPVPATVPEPSGHARTASVPSGPKRTSGRSSPTKRPPPLDLTSISAFRVVEERLSQIES